MRNADAPTSTTDPAQQHATMEHGLAIQCDYTHMDIYILAVWLGAVWFGGCVSEGRGKFPTTTFRLKIELIITVLYAVKYWQELLPQSKWKRCIITSNYHLIMTFLFPGFRGGYLFCVLIQTKETA